MSSQNVLSTRIRRLADRVERLRITANQVYVREIVDSMGPRSIHEVGQHRIDGVHVVDLTVLRVCSHWLTLNEKTTDSKSSSDM
jgi:hypothetical protein